MADDDEDDCFFFKEALSNVIGKANIICAINGEELLQLLKDRIPPAPDFIFLDLNMPKKSGHECLKEIRNNPFYTDLRIVILTTSKAQRDIDMTYQNGADYYICKPASMTDYETALQKLFSFTFQTRPAKEEFVIN